MLMFRSRRRTTLAKRLWKLSLNRSSKIDHRRQQQQQQLQQQQQSQQLGGSCHEEPNETQSTFQNSGNNNGKAAVVCSQSQDSQCREQRQQQQQQQDTSSSRDSCCREGGSGGSSSDTVAAEMELKSVTHSLLKRLKETQLLLLVEAVESRGVGPPGGGSSSCVLVPKGEIRIGRRTVLPHVLCCQLWRWSDVRQPFELKRLACCSTQPDDPAYVCSNPYHWSRLSQPESPPPYTRCALDWISPEDCDVVDELNPVSVATGGSNQFASYSSTLQGGEGVSPKKYWCYLAYWEMRTRVGRQFPVHKNLINVFSDLPQGDGLCLGTLAKQNLTTNDAIRRTREKIGLGLVVSKEVDGVWAYNRSDYAIFVNSPTLQPYYLTNARFTVYKVPPGHSIKIFDYDKSRLYQKLEKELSKEIDGSESGGHTDGPFDPNSVRISFAKGWGPKYSRQVITSCPCWLEILLVPPR